MASLGDKDEAEEAEAQLPQLKCTKSTGVSLASFLPAPKHSVDTPPTAAGGQSNSKSSTSGSHGNSSQSGGMTPSGPLLHAPNVGVQQSQWEEEEDSAGILGLAAYGSSSDEDEEEEEKKNGKNARGTECVKETGPLKLKDPFSGEAHLPFVPDSVKNLSAPIVKRKITERTV